MGAPSAPRALMVTPYSSFFLGKIQDIFVQDTWLVLDRLDDHDERDFDQKIATKAISLIKPLPTQVFCETLTCAMAAEAVTRQRACYARSPGGPALYRLASCAPGTNLFDPPPDPRAGGVLDQAPGFGAPARRLVSHHEEGGVRAL